APLAAPEIALPALMAPLTVCAAEAAVSTVSAKLSLRSSAIRSYPFVWGWAAASSQWTRYRQSSRPEPCRASCPPRLQHTAYTRQCRLRRELSCTGPPAQHTGLHGTYRRQCPPGAPV